MSVSAQMLSGEDACSIDLVLIDDDKLTLEIVSWILRGSAVSYQLFSDTSLALDYLTENNPHILIADYYMPGINGIEFLKEFDPDQKHANTRKFLCSAIVPQGYSPTAMQFRGITLLEKQVICDRAALHELLEKNL